MSDLNHDNKPFKFKSFEGALIFDLTSRLTINSIHIIGSVSWGFGVLGFWGFGDFVDFVDFWDFSDFWEFS